MMKIAGSESGTSSQRHGSVTLLITCVFKGDEASFQRVWTYSNQVCCV
jgi:hypothetical protein